MLIRAVCLSMVALIGLVGATTDGGDDETWVSTGTTGITTGASATSPGVPADLPAGTWSGHDINAPPLGADPSHWANCFSSLGAGAFFNLYDCIKPLNADLADPGAPAITISDLAAFTPNPVTLSTQPDGWGVANVPTNFVTDAAPHVQSGQLLGQPVQVRWIPVAFHYDYGDGHTATVEHPGVRWFDDEPWAETPTSHVYDSKDDVVVHLTIEYAAEVDFGSGWIQVQGTITQALPPYPLKLYEVRTVLTRGDCYQYPNDPGCG